MARYENIDITRANVTNLYASSSTVTGNVTVGGTITSTGKITANGGFALGSVTITQASVVSPASTIQSSALLTGGNLDAEKIATAINAIKTVVNGVISSLQTAGLMAST